MSEQFDIVVIGAGPAGLAAALEAARSGCRVLLLERFKEVGQVVNCAEGVTVGSIVPLLDIKPAWIMNRIDRGILVSPSGKRFEMNHPNAGYVLDRVRMQQGLAESYVAAGGELRTGLQAIALNQEGDRFAEIQVLNIETNQTSVIGADIFIDAEGVEGKLARGAGIINQLRLAQSESYIQYRLRNISFDPGEIELHIGQKIAPRSYVWIFPRGSEEMTVGLGAASDLDVDPCRLLDNFVAKRFPKAEKVASACGLSPRYQSPRTMAAANMLVVGDAARLLETVTGAGISLAIMSGQQAGRAASEFCQGRVLTLEGLHAIYPGQFVAEKHRLLNNYRKVKELMDKLSDRDLDEVVVGLNEVMGRKKVDSVNAFELFLKVIRKRPRLLALARHFF